MMNKQKRKFMRSRSDFYTKHNYIHAGSSRDYTKTYLQRAQELIIRNSETGDNCKHKFICIIYFVFASDKISIVMKQT